MFHIIYYSPFPLLPGETINMCEWGDRVMAFTTEVCTSLFLSLYLSACAFLFPMVYATLVFLFD